MSDFGSILLWVIYPYAMLLSFVFGTIIRFGWFRGGITAVSSEMLEKRKLMVGSLVFHVGIILAFFGHILGILIPKTWTAFFGISDETYHIFGSLMMGTGAGLLALAGIIILTYRRFSNPRVFLTSSWSDLVVNVALLITIILGLASTISSGFVEFDYRSTLSVWARSLFYLHPQWQLMATVPWIYKIHVICGFAIFGFFPYTRLIHALTLPWQYIFRRFIVYRRRPRY
ncbi:nitrate reductase, gamma chain [Secundilactobacillus odoratitofui DSM 19909 = JCM 15043]|uniref:Nitrate reductase, gamma chain n=1 Tax=Secundilactobacillus odoratitofui DSM 19909 = JCM 15043 TaxID=1423776 RepID=A0A0R1LPI4_9LACO|nr:respiratory nitrate reductase subunit gamma [Secundilactobacillus odoratitofui]KRK97766.1 nitrate reductase, gamma chain [Secundilactobacillus odoratitofui DSM 19909 = JCM 15043]